MSIHIVKKPVIVTLDIFYYMPRHVHLIQEFVWQLDDRYPGLDRTHHFMNHWKTNIHAIIKTVEIGLVDVSTMRNVQFNNPTSIQILKSSKFRQRFNISFRIKKSNNQLPN